MEAHIRSLDAAIANNVSTNNRAGAYVKLMKRKGLERKLARTRSLCDVCRNTLESIRQSDDMCVTMDALDAANVFVKDALVTTTSNLSTVDDVSETFNDLQQTAREMHDAVASSFDNNVDHEELESELERLFEGDSSTAPRIKIPSTQHIPTVESSTAKKHVASEEIGALDEMAFPTVPSSLPVSERVKTRNA
ncbi:hypothetical protein CYMTET_3867 [Cymbomonas tetramitiformis]|uniref:Uncharacterized protein n=1 Tax=Cymbomonas tetramitiformis TaxID=36881 RepID=A0AAE0LL23_9CHLO|nr:hypothetical protein CYMTET_3867 [Cymbomonas tetramitiformis]